MAALAGVVAGAAVVFEVGAAPVEGKTGASCSEAGEWTALEELLAGLEVEGSWARPAVMPTEDWTQRRNGELWTATRKRLRFRGVSEAAAARSDSASA
jgi:hypothetical protein